MKLAAGVTALAGVTWGVSYVELGGQFWLLGSATFFGAAGWFTYTAWVER